MCPTVYKDGADGIDRYKTKVPDFTYALEDSDAFYKAISDVYGIRESWIRFGDVDMVVESMQAVVKEADEIKKAESEEMILKFITRVLFLKPFVGDATGAAGMTAVRSAFELLDATSDASLLAYSVIKQAKNAFLTVFSILASAGVERVGWRDAAHARQDMSTYDIKKLGSVKTNLDLI
ncbi:hypothetical protein J3E68DRAFT_449387 [Trichoderma sp. SZMC 28012]